MRLRLGAPGRARARPPLLGQVVKPLSGLVFVAAALIAVVSVPFAIMMVEAAQDTECRPHASPPHSSLSTLPFTFTLAHPPPTCSDLQAIST